MKSWRPEGWENPYSEYPDLSCQKQTKEWLLYESGANAMLEALKKEGTYHQGAKPITFTFGSQIMFMPIPAGWGIFIPDEEEEG